jgi:molybdate transport system substrate-binding protein
VKFLSALRATVYVSCVALFAFGCRKESAPGDSPQTQDSTTAPVHRLNIAAAADLKFALEEIVAAFHVAHPDIELKTTYGSSGNFYAQLSNHAPFDVFLSADVSYPHKLQDAGLVMKDMVAIYATGRIVLWAPNDSKLNLAGMKWNALLDPSVKKIAIANPEHAPYGRAARAALESQHLWSQVQPKLVLGENIAQTAQFVQSGSADVGIIALSLALSPQMKAAGSYWMIAPEDYPEMKQEAVVLSYTPEPAAASAFEQFLTSSDAKEVFKRYGFGAP